MKKTYKIIFSDGMTKEVEGTVFQTMLMPKHSFGIRKEKEFYVADHINSGRSMNIYAKSENEVINEISKIISDAKKKQIIISCPNLNTTIDLFKQFSDYKTEFENTTKIKLPINQHCGIDFITLNKKLKCNDVKLSQYINNKYGKQAKDLLDKMIECNPSRYCAAYETIAEWLNQNY